MPLFNDADHFLLVPDFNSPLIYLEKFITVRGGGVDHILIIHILIDHFLFDHFLMLLTTFFGARF